MARFTFKLEGVLKQRRHVEHERQRTLAEAQQVLTAAERALTELDADVQGVSADVRENHLVGILDLRFITAHRRYMVGVQQRALSLAEAIARARVIVEDARTQLATAALARKALEKLRETQEARWRVEEAKKETARLDEAGMQIAFQNITEAEENAS